MVLSKQICSEKAPSSWDYQPNLSIWTIQETPSDPVCHLLALFHVPGHPQKIGLKAHKSQPSTQAEKKGSTNRQ